MNVFTLLTNWCSRDSKPVLTREEVGIASNFTSRSSRFDSLSIVSRQSVLRTYLQRLASILLLVLTVGVGNVWALTKTEGFETKTASATYNSTTYITTSESDCDISWTIYYGCVSTNSKLSGSNSAAMRLYSHNSMGYGYLQSTTAISNLSQISFKAKAGAGNSGVIKMDVEYSIDNGDNWSYMRMTSSSGSNYASQTPSSSGDTYTAYVPSGVTGDFLIRFSINTTSTRPSKPKSGTNNVQLTIDDVVFTYTSACSHNVTLTYDGDADTHGCTFVLKAGSSSGSTIAEGGTTANCGSGTTTVAVVTTPAEHYHVASVNATNKTGDISDQGSGVYHISYSQGSNISSTVTVTFEEDTKYTVTWTANGSQHAQTQVYNGEKPTFPSAPISPDATSNTFYGWATSTWSGSLDDISAKTVYTYGAAMPTVTGNVEYQAVWAKPTTTYQILGYGDILTDGNYVIDAYYNSTDYAMGNSIVSYKIAGTSVTPSGDDDEYLISPAAALIWKISHIDGTYVSLYNANAATNHYLGLTSSGLTLESSPTTNGQFNPVLTEEEGYATTVAFQSKSQLGKELQNYKSSFQSYTSQSSNIYLYRQVLEKYATTFCSALGSINGSIL